MPKPQHSWVRAFIIGFILVLLFGVTRLPNLTDLPIFTDEAIYIRWSQIGMRDANWRFISLTDGKQPMFTWVMMGLLKLFEQSDPLFVGRLTSVIAGFFTMVALWLLSYELFRNKKLSILVVFLYCIVPFTVWYDRVALYDSMVSTFSVWSLYLGVLLSKNPRLDTSLLLGMFLGAGMLNKSSGFLSLYFLPITLLLFDWKNPNLKNRLFKWVGLVIISAVLSQILYSILRLSPFFHMIGQKDTVFIFTIREWINQPFRFFAGNLAGMFDWLRHYLTLPFFIAVLLSIVQRGANIRERILLFLWWLLPFVALANFAKVLYPRFILFMSMPLLILASYSVLHIWEHMRGKWRRFLFIAVVFAPSLYISMYIVISPELAQIPFADRGQFIDDWPAGGGVKEVVSFISEKAKKTNVSVYTEGNFGLMPASLEIYLVDNPNIRITGIWPLPHEIPQAMLTDAKTHPTYLILNETQIAPHGWPIQLVGEYKKGPLFDRKRLRLYEVILPVASML